MRLAFDPAMGWNPKRRHTHLIPSILMINDKTVLITGGTGSFGKAITRTILERYKPARLIVFSRDELKQLEMARSFPRTHYPCIRYFIGDVRDAGRLRRAFQGVDYVVHAAALKQVDTAEYNPFEVIKTNILGAANVVDAAIDTGVTKVIALSSDKAANPINLYGATKLCADKLFIAANTYSSRQKTRFAIVRYGNVIGSRGSVVPLFLKQREQGALTVTHPEMTRFWITLRRGVDFVLRSLDSMKGGEIFIPKLPSMKMIDLAHAVAPECGVSVIGIRPGEKMHEVMIPSDESSHAMEFDDHYILYPAFPFWGDGGGKRPGRPVTEGFQYSSDTNKEWLGVDELRQLVSEVEKNPEA